ncbi:MAG: trigger factor [Patescibacteria group bacterium]
MAIQVSVSKKEKSELEITGEIPSEIFESHREAAVKYLALRVNIPGFRKGKAPENILAQHTGDMTILEEMAERALGKAYPDIIAENKLDVVGDPAVQITKIAKGSPLGFKITVAVSPEVILPDYKKIAERAAKEPIQEVSVTDDEVEKTIEEIRKLRARTVTENQELRTKNAEGSGKGKELPPLTDENVKELGEFENLADLRKKIKENIRTEKKTKEMQKRRAALTEELVKESSVDVPHILIERELDRLMAQFASDISRMGLQFDKYLEHLKKTVEEIRTEWRPQAEKNVKIGLILTKIAEMEKVSADPAAVETEVKHIMEHYPGAREERARAYAATILKHEKVFEFLENQGA